MEKPLRKKGAPQGTFVSDVIYGCVNSVMCIPVMISFTSIIFRDPAFAPYLPKLVKLVLFSSAVHQMSFSLYSSLPFAVGQVQDAGLIFLSAMADSVVQICGASSGKTLPTTLFVVSCATVVLGIFLMIMGKMKLASVVQYVQTCPHPLHSYLHSICAILIIIQFLFIVVITFLLVTHSPT